MIFGALQDVTEDLTVRYNANLNNLFANKISTIGGDLNIRYNPMLPNAMATTIRDNAHYVGGTISNNAP